MILKVVGVIVLLVVGCMLYRKFSAKPPCVGCGGESLRPVAKREVTAVFATAPNPEIAFGMGQKKGMF